MGGATATHHFNQVTCVFQASFSNYDWLAIVWLESWTFDLIPHSSSYVLNSLNDSLLVSTGGKSVISLILVATTLPSSVMLITTHLRQICYWETSVQRIKTWVVIKSFLFLPLSETNPISRLFFSLWTKLNKWFFMAKLNVWDSAINRQHNMGGKT